MVWVEFNKKNEIDGEKCSFVEMLRFFPHLIPNLTSEQRDKKGSGSTH